MRSGNWRGVAIALGLTIALTVLTGNLGASSARADGFACTIPDLVPAVNQNTGQPYMAPPIPYGHYVGKNLGGKLGGGLLGLGHGLGGGLGGVPCGSCGGAGCSACGGSGFTKHGLCLPGFSKPACGIGGIPCGPKVFASKQCAPSSQCVKPSRQCVKPSMQCITPGCGLMGKHGLPGCCLLGNHGLGGIPCASCGGAGCGLCAGGLGGVKGLLGGLLHTGDIKWFVGPGGPVPITPGYTPYVVTTRSPRDFLAFPPYTP